MYTRFFKIIIYISLIAQWLFMVKNYLISCHNRLTQSSYVNEMLIFESNFFLVLKRDNERSNSFSQKPLCDNSISTFILSVLSLCC